MCTTPRRANQAIRFIPPVQKPEFQASAEVHRRRARVTTRKQGQVGDVTRGQKPQAHRRGVAMPIGAEPAERLSLTTRRQALAAVAQDGRDCREAALGSIARADADVYGNEGFHSAGKSVNGCGGQRRDGTCTARQQHAVRHRAFLQRFHATDKVSAIGKIDVVDTGIGTGLGNAIVLALKRPRGVDQQVGIQCIEPCREVSRHRIQRHVTEGRARARLKVVDERLRRDPGAARNNDMQAVLTRKSRHQPAAEESVAADDDDPIGMHVLV